ncbi:MAG: MBL fold metallo-hydrolase [bacterium]
MIKNVAIIRSGSLAFQCGEELDAELYEVKKLLGVNGESSVVLVQTEELNILIDTGFRNEYDLSTGNIEQNRMEMTDLLRHHRLRPSDINEVFITHWHHDHFGNLPLFESATIAFAGIPAEEVRHLSGRFAFSSRLVELQEGGPWHEGLSVIHTPGHNGSHHAVVIDFRGWKFVAAGDAIVSKCYYDADSIYPYNRDFLSKEVALESMEKIKCIADIIIPGHGQPFQNWKGNKKDL